MSTSYISFLRILFVYLIQFPLDIHVYKNDNKKVNNPLQVFAIWLRILKVIGAHVEGVDRCIEEIGHCIAPNGELLVANARSH